METVFKDKILQILKLVDKNICSVFVVKFITEFDIDELVDRIALLLRKDTYTNCVDILVEDFNRLSIKNTDFTQDDYLNRMKSFLQENYGYVIG